MELSYGDYEFSTFSNGRQIYLFYMVNISFVISELRDLILIFPFSSSITKEYLLIRKDFLVY